MAAQATAFHLVLEKFKASLSDKEKKQFAATTIDDLSAAIETIQQKQQSEKKLRAMSQLERFLEGMKEYDKVLSVFLNTSTILAFVWVACTFHEAFDALMNAYQRIGEHMPLLAQYEDYFRNHPRMFQLLRLIYEDILNFHWKAMKYFKKRMWQQFFQALWKSFDAEFSNILRNLREHMALIESQATVAQFAEIIVTRARVELEFDRQRDEEIHRRRIMCHQWLVAANCGADQETYARVRQEYPGTGQWFLQKNRFRSWFDPNFCSTPLLWMNGIPGAGKTILASLVIEEAQKLQDVHIAFFYCRYQDNDKSTFLRVARVILSQLLLQDDGLLSYLYNKMSTSGQVTLSKETVAKELLEIALKAFEKLYIVIDGIDECEKDERHKIVSLFEKTWESLPQGDADQLRCLFVSQDDNIARKDFEKMPSLKVTESDTQRDIVTYVTAKSLRIKTKFDLTADRQLLIQDQIIKSADGMFLFAHLMTSYLLDQTSVAELENELSPEKIPQGSTRLEDMYLIDKHCVDLGSGEAALALLCLGYLVFEGFDVEYDELDISERVPSGYYGFLDYAYAYWSRHVDAYLRVHDTNESTLREVSESAEVFMDMYWTQPQTKTVVPKSFFARWELLKDNRNFDELVVAGYLAQRQLVALKTHATDAQAPKLCNMLTKVRECLENVVSPANATEKLRLMYGKDIFRCPKVHCVRFYSGFSTAQEREDHVLKHERSFFCSFPGCAMAILGCATLKELHKHETDFHGTFDFDDDEAEYPDLPPRTVSYDCTQCDAKFTRNFNLKNHMRSRHQAAESRPTYVCTTCGKSFGKKGDCDRHETTTHSRAKSFVCGGELKDGTPWGCRREFNRGDILKRHWTSAIGKVCMLPKQQEEEAEAASSNASARTSTVSTPNT
ncbi:hypothetical protein KJE20_07591 [Pyrenophora tritici-repentis]|nr:hypothetical protein KJE20_07591 [Pyrenophora tritici-repentis]